MMSKASICMGLLTVVQGFAGTCRLPRAVGRTTAIVSTSSLFLSDKSRQYNSFSTLIGDMASSLLGKTMSPNPAVDKALTNVGTTSWQNVRSLLESSMETNDERLFRQNLDKGYGVGSPLHKVRLYDESNQEQDIRVTFYRDSASWCPYCHKVWMSLEEKKIPYRVEKVNMRCYGDKPSSFMRIQPNGQIPVAVIDDKGYGQSNDIIYALEELFPEHKALIPKGQEGKVQELLRLERQIFSTWMYWLTSSGDPDGFRHTFVETLQKVERALAASSGPFFMGNDITTVDIQFAPFLERMAASLLFFKGFQMRIAKGEPTDFPNLNKWFDAMEAKPCYQLTKSDYYTHCWDLPPQVGGCTYEPAAEPYEKAINGERSIDGTQGSWELPLQPHNGGVEPDWDWAGDEAAAKREAVERVSANFENIVKFAARGAGKKGMPPVSAPLADPNATPSDAVKGSVDTSLQTVCMAMLEGVEKHDATMTKIGKTIIQEGGKEFADGVIASLAYMRDRVGVPRDMKLPAARQLRAHLNWAIGKISDAQDE